MPWISLVGKTVLHERVSIIQKHVQNKPNLCSPFSFVGFSMLISCYLMILPGSYLLKDVHIGIPSSGGRLLVFFSNIVFYVIALDS